MMFNKHIKFEKTPSHPEKILITTDTLGTGFNYAVGLARKLGQGGYKVVLAVMGPRKSLHRIEEAGTLSNVKILTFPCQLEWMNEPWADVDSAANWLKDLELQFNPDVIHLNQFAVNQGQFSAPVLMVAHTCIFSWFSSVRSSAPPSEWSRYHFSVKNALASAEGVTALSEPMLDDLVENYGVFDRLPAIPIGREVYSSSFRTKKQDFILSSGNIWDEAKNIRLLDDIAPELKWPVRVAGAVNNEHNSDFCSFENIKCLGELSQNALRKQMNQAAIFAAPSLYEPVGLAILEAACAGCALVLADIPTLRSTWNHRALFADPRDPESWGSCLNCLSTNPSLRRVFASRARSYATSGKFDLDTVTSGYLELYRFIMAKQSLTSQLFGEAVSL